MNLDWLRLKAVVIESDDWGLCAWSPDERAHRALLDTPVFRSPSGRRYGGSTLESAADVGALCSMLNELRGADGFPPVWQANTVVASPDYDRMRPPRFEGEAVPILDPPSTASRWQRPGLAEAIERARTMGIWWPELHGLHHLPEHGWLQALRRGDADAVRALEHQSPVCQAVQNSGEYDPSEPRELRRRHLERSIEMFRRQFGRAPESLCAPDYRWDAALEDDAETLGVTTIQGLAEQHGHRFPRFRRLALRHRWPNRAGRRFYLPQRIAFEPSAVDASRHGGHVEEVRARVRQAWGRAQPAIVSTHRVNYAHLQSERSAAGRAALRSLLERLIEDGAVFLVDTEARQLAERGWSVRHLTTRSALVRRYGAPAEPIRFEAPSGATGVEVRDGRASSAAEARLDGQTFVARFSSGELLVDWT